MAGVKKLSIVVRGLRHSTPTFALLNDANPTRVQKMMRHQHYATTEIYVEEVQKLLEGAEEAVTQIEATRYGMSQSHMSHWSTRVHVVVRLDVFNRWIGSSRSPRVCTLSSISRLTWPSWLRYRELLIAE